jgi:hypothetical protein
MFIFRSQQLTLAQRSVFSVLARELSFANADGREAEPLSASLIAQTLRSDRYRTVGPALQFLLSIDLASRAGRGWRAVAEIGDGVAAKWFVLRQHEPTGCWVDGLAYHNVDLLPGRTLRQNYIALLDNGKSSARSIARAVDCSHRTVGRFKLTAALSKLQDSESKSPLQKIADPKPKEESAAQFIYRELRKDNCPGDLAVKIAQTLCLNCDYQDMTYAHFYNLRGRARELFDPTKSKVSHVYVLMLGIVKQWVKRKNETTKQRLERIKREKEKKCTPITLDRSKRYKIRQQVYHYDPVAKIWFRRDEWDADELGDPIPEDELAEIVKGLRMAG